MPEVSVVVPTHNRSELLALTLRSILRQHDVDLEVIVVDDGSSDDTSEVTASFADPRIRLVRHPAAEGVAAARNRGAAEAVAEWVGFCDDDDLWAPNKLVAQLHAAHQSGREWAYTGAVSIDRSLQVLGGMPPPPPDQMVKLLPRYNAIPGGGSNVVVRREALERAGPFQRRLYNTEDWEMWLRLVRQGPPAGVLSPQVGYRVHASNASLHIHQILAGADFIERQHGTRVDRGVLYRWFAESCLRAGRRGAAVRYLAAAAGRGQARNVTGDVLAILRRKIGGQLLVGRAPRLPDYPYPEWVAEARAWLSSLALAESAGAGSL